MKPALQGLYAITDQRLMPVAHFADKAEAALAAGARILQYRDKSVDQHRRKQQATRLRELCSAYDALLIINDDLSLAREVDADGVHIGKDDFALATARKQLGENRIIGVSCYNQIELAESAIQGGADYVAFGSFFNSSIKPEAPVAGAELISNLKQRFDTPVCCIGGITTTNCPPLIEAGADMLAVISDVFAHETLEQIERSCRTFSQLLSR